MTPTAPGPGPDPTPPAPNADSTPAPAPSEGRKGLPPVARTLIGVAIVAVAGLAAWLIVGRELYDQYAEYRLATESRDASAPVGYLGLNYRKEYNSRPPVFHFESDGRKQLFASIGDGVTPEFYDVTDAQFDPQVLQGGFGRDSIAGIDYPILQEPDGEVAANISDRHQVAGIVVDGVPRAYPVDLLSKIEIVNDTIGDVPVLVYYARGPDTIHVYRREFDGRPITLGTTGYSTGEKVPLVYDRKSRGLWLPSESRDTLICVNGEHVGAELSSLGGLVRTDWGQWRRDHPDTLVVVGNDRSKEIPAE